MNEIKISKGQILQRAGDTKAKIYLVKSGLLRSYIIDQKGKEHIFLFALQKILNRLEALQNRVIMMMSSTAIERYEHFVKTYPKIIQRVPQRMIASYLGITPEALSNVKGKQKTLKS